MSPVVLRTAHTSSKFVFSGEIKDSRTSSPRLTNGTVSLLSRNIMSETINSIPVSPYTLIIEVHEHKCFISISDQEVIILGAGKFSLHFLMEAEYI